MLKKTITAILLGGVFVPALWAAPVYSCQSGGQSVYTSEPSGDCAESRLTGISSYAGSGHTLKASSTAKAKSKKRPSERIKQAKTKTAKAKNNRQKRAAKRVGNKDRTGWKRGYSGFSGLPGKEMK